MSPPDPPSSGGSQVTVTTSLWLLVSAVASLICGVLSLLCLGAFAAGLLGVWLYVASIACGVIGVVLGHRARARRAATHSGNAALATAGLVLSYGGVLLSLAFYVLVLLAVTQIRT